MSRRSPYSLFLPLAILALVAGCRANDVGARESTGAHPSSVTPAARTPVAPLLSVPETVGPRPAPSELAPKLSAQAEWMAQMLVFFVDGQTWLTAAARRKRLVVDIGRVDATVRTAVQRRAFQEAVRAESPIQIGDRLRLHGPWGSDDAIVKGFADVSGRIVATLELPPSIDSLARTADDSLVAVAARADSATPPVADSCLRASESVSAELTARVAAVSDSLQQRLHADTLHLSERLKRSVWTRSSHAVGCFGPDRVLLIVTLASAGYDYVREVAVLLDDAGGVTPLRVKPLRFKAHDALLAFDADGDGVDDIAVKGRGERVGGTAVLRLDLRKRQLDFLTQGFAWEGR